MFVCNCFGVTEEQVRQHVVDGACTPRQIASACRAGTDCGSCVQRIQALLGRSPCPRRTLADQGRPALTAGPVPPADPATAPAPAPARAPAPALPAAEPVAPAPALAEPSAPAAA